MIARDMVMNYATGDAIKLGDKVGLGKDRGGVVISLIDAKEHIYIGEYGEAYTEPPWEFLKKGVLVYFPMYGMIHYENEAEEDLEFISRGSVPVDRKR